MSALPKLTIVLALGCSVYLGPSSPAWTASNSRYRGRARDNTATQRVVRPFRVNAAGHHRPSTLTALGSTVCAVSTPAEPGDPSADFFFLRALQHAKAARRGAPSDLLVVVGDLAGSGPVQGHKARQLEYILEEGCRTKAIEHAAGRDDLLLEAALEPLRLLNSRYHWPNGDFAEAASLYFNLAERKLAIASAGTAPVWAVDLDRGRARRLRVDCCQSLGFGEPTGGTVRTLRPEDDLVLVATDGFGNDARLQPNEVLRSSLAALRLNPPSKKDVSTLVTGVVTQGLSLVERALGEATARRKRENPSNVPASHDDNLLAGIKL